MKAEVCIVLLLLYCLGAVLSLTGQKEQECIQLWHQKWQRYEQHRSIRAQALQHSTTNGKLVWDPWEPEWSCDVEERMGEPAWGDGPKFMCNPAVTLAVQPCLVYSFGSNGKIQFESAVHKLAPGCEIHVFDPTDDPDTSAVVARVGTFHLWGLGAESKPFSLGQVMPLTDIMHKLGHAGRRLDNLKVDVEGAEWDSFNQHIWPLCGNGSLLISQLQVELHLKGDMNRGDRSTIQRFFEGADACELMVFHKERNAWGCGGFRCLEYALIHKSAAMHAFVASHCPSVAESVLQQLSLSSGHDYASALNNNNKNNNNDKPMTHHLSKESEELQEKLQTLHQHLHS